MSPLFVLGVILSLGFCGLCLDIGLIDLQQRQMQTAADAAAIAGEMQFERGISASGSDAGLAAAAQHGFTDGVSNTSVTYISDPGGASASYNAATIGDYAGHYDAVQILITRQVPTIFMGVLGITSVQVEATATASPPPCVYYLGLKNLQTPTVLLSNADGAPVSYAGCPAYIGGDLTVPSGGWWQDWQTYLTGSPGGSSLLGVIKRGTTFNAPVRTDPLAYLAQPTAGGCAATNYSHGSLASQTTITLNPGTYCGTYSAGVVTPGMTLLNVNVTFNPGLYVITGGINWQQTNTTGNGVTFFFTKVGGTTKYGTVVMTTLSQINLSAASGTTFGVANSNGALAGILFFCDRNWVNTNAQDFQYNSSTGWVNGVWYMPSTGIAFHNGWADCNWNSTVTPASPIPSNACGLIADNLWDSAFQLSMLGFNFTGIPGGAPTRQNSVLVQ